MDNKKIMWNHDPYTWLLKDGEIQPRVYKALCTGLITKGMFHHWIAGQANTGQCPGAYIISTVTSYVDSGDKALLATMRDCIMLDWANRMESKARGEDSHG